VDAKRPGGEKSPFLIGFSPPPALRADPPLAGRDEPPVSPRFNLKWSNVRSPMQQTNSHMRISGIAAGLWLGAVIGALGFDAVCAEERKSTGQTLDGQLSTPRVGPALTLPRQCICTMEYDPVCGRTVDGVEITFSNPCRARCAGATVIRRGAC
jgi:hypothetical protein